MHGMLVITAISKSLNFTVEDPMRDRLINKSTHIRTLCELIRTGSILFYITICDILYIHLFFFQSDSSTVSIRDLWLVCKRNEMVCVLFSGELYIEYRERFLRESLELVNLNIRQSNHLDEPDRDTKIN